MMSADLVLDLAIQATCTHCEKKIAFRVNNDDFQRYKSGVAVQRAFPYLNASDRELFVSGLCGACWDALIPEF